VVPSSLSNGNVVGNLEVEVLVEMVLVVLARREVLEVVVVAVGCT
jgi:hypothetical protein